MILDNPKVCNHDHIWYLATFIDSATCLFTYLDFLVISTVYSFLNIFLSKSCIWCMYKLQCTCTMYMTYYIHIEFKGKSLPPELQFNWIELPNLTINRNHEFKIKRLQKCILLQTMAIPVLANTVMHSGIWTENN